jgi:hypothetical protein
MYESSCNFTGDDIIAPFIAQIECPAQWVFLYEADYGQRGIHRPTVRV